MAPVIEPYDWASDLAPDDLATIARLFNEVWAEWVPGERPVSVAAFVDLDRFTAHPEQRFRRLVRGLSGAVLAWGQVSWREGPGACSMRVLVDPPHRRQGVGRALGAALTDVARAAGRTGVTIEAVAGSQAEAILRAAGFAADMEVEQNRTDVASIPDDLLDGWRAVGEAAPGYSLVTYDAPCPTDALAEDFIRARQAMNDAPRFEGEADVTYTVAELRAVEAASAASHQAWWNVGVRHDATGDVVGLSEMYLWHERPWLAIQGDTAVVPTHRGHGLGAWMKAVNHERLRDEHPEVETVQTWNAASNEPMLRINRALGFAPVQRYRGWHLPLTPLP